MIGWNARGDLDADGRALSSSLTLLTSAVGKRAGRRLYTHHILDHAKLFMTTARLNGDFLMTYDNPDEVSGLALKHGFETRTIAMKNTHRALMTEVFIGRNLSYISR